MASPVLHLQASDWQLNSSIDYKAQISLHRALRVHAEQFDFREGFRVVRWSVQSFAAHWQPEFNDLDYVGCCFNFAAHPQKQYALAHLYQPQMNITSGYEFAGGVNNISDGKPFYYVALLFSRAYLDELRRWQALPNWLEQLYANPGIVNSRAVPALWRERAWQMCALPMGNSLHKRLQLEALSLQWLADILQLQQCKTSLDSHIEQALAIIKSQYNQELTISKLAMSVGTNACYLKQRFKAQTGSSINQYITSYRLQIARELLRQRPDLSIKMVAALCGYRANYFSELFRRQVGLSPLEYRRK